MAYEKEFMSLTNQVRAPVQSQSIFHDMAQDVTVRRLEERLRQVVAISVVPVIARATSCSLRLSFLVMKK
jgi:hypothetical protein